MGDGPACIHHPADQGGDFFHAGYVDFIAPWRSLGEGEGWPARLDGYGDPSAPLGLELLQGALGEKAAMVHQTIAGTDLLGIAQLVGAQKDGDPFLPGQAAEKGMDSLGTLGIQP